MPKLKWPLLALAASLILNLLLAAKIFFPQKAALASGTVSRVIDGDTFVLADGTHVRIKNIDAPEYAQGCLSAEAKERLEQLILNKIVSLKNTSFDDFKRTLANVFLNDLDIGQTIVTEGLAAIESGSTEPTMLMLQDQAQAAARGIWSSQCQAPPDKNCTIKGNVRPESKAKTYHLKNCYNYAKIVISSADGDRWFCSEKEAQAAGFTISLDCPKK